MIRIKDSVFFFVFLICLMRCALAQDTLFTKKGTYIACTVKEIINNEYIIYTLGSDQKQHEIKCDALTYLSLRQGSKLYFVPRSSLDSYAPFQTKNNLFELGFYLSPIGLHTGAYLKYNISSRNFAQLNAGAKISCPQAFDEVLNFFAHKASGFYSGPILQLNLCHLTMRVPHNGIRRSSLVYDFRYRLVKKYYWIDGSPGLSSTYREDRSEQVYAHTLLYILSTTYNINTKLDWGLFLGGGVQWGHKRIHHYASSGNSVNPTNLYDRFSSESLFPAVFRLGVFFEFKATKSSK
jgi:hypothetical protein